MDNLPAQLPPIRREVSCYPGGVDFTGTPTWVMHDPLNNQFFQLGWIEHTILSKWHLGAPDDIIRWINTHTTLRIRTQTLSRFFEFLKQNALVELTTKELKPLFDMHEQRKEQSLFMKAVHSYLFFRVPIVKPDAFLDALLPRIRFIFTQQFFMIMMLVLIAGLYLVSRQWDIFANTFSDFFSVQGMILFGIGVSICKVCHELGHALTCKLNGCRVPVMGVAFLVMWPTLYTDTIESWRVPDPKKRIQISLGGVWVEMYLAIISLFLWNFVPDGLFRGVLFFIATINFLMTILINISPFLRFDGYHVLSDFLGVRNLQTRSFNYTRWRIRKTLFGFKTPMPEALTGKQQAIFFFYAIGCWIYRFILFIGIAIMVYYLFFKALGIVLFIIEMLFFIILPVVQEFKVWWRMRSMMTFNRNTVATICVLVFIFMMLFVPWRSQIDVPATMSFEQQTLYAPYPGKVQAIHVQPGTTVHQGQLLLTLNSEKMGFDIAQAKAHVEKVKYELKNSHIDEKNLKERQVLEREYARAKARVQGLERKAKKLQIQAPFDGQISFLSPSIHKGTWMQENERLITVINPKVTHINAFVERNVLEKLKTGENAMFYAENLSISPVKATIVNIDYQHTQKLSTAPKEQDTNRMFLSHDVQQSTYLASTYGGDIAVRPDNEQNLIPEYSVYRVMLRPKEAINIERVQRGAVHLNVKPQSVIVRLYKHVAAVLIRESGF